MNNITQQEIDSLIHQSKLDNIDRIVVGGIILNNKGQALIVKRSDNDSFLPGILEFPSGHIDPGETIFEALIREIKEETNYDIKTIQSYLDSFDYFSKSGKKVRQFIFIVEVNSGKPILNPEEHQAYFWCNYEEAQALGADRTVLNRLEKL